MVNVFDGTNGGYEPELLFFYDSTFSYRRNLFLFINNPTSSLISSISFLLHFTMTAMKTQEEQISDQLQKLQVNEKENESAVDSTQNIIDSLPNLNEVEEILGYGFTNKRLLEEAFTHVSLGHGLSNERLEYVGDSVLNLLFTKHQYFEYPDLPPGVLTRLRAANVDTEKLARVAIKHGLHRFLRHKKPLLEKQIRQFSQEIQRYPLHSNGLVDVPKALADLVESVIGAVFIDANFSIDIVWKVFKDLLEPIIRRETLKIHPVTQLYEVCQKRNLKVKFEDLWKESTAFNVFIDDQLVGRGACSLKKEIAHNRAAKDALDNILKILDHKDNSIAEETNSLTLY
ncbi:ribonuclease 3-like protein 3 [Durio zibethinus]|uniref:Ribonuclease 3-like protein 3 n=1 Tax=Durio zibethinus TaxID=66656 RepID=A0A6P6A5P6_DURZI|nr:ribonuclease 3-like protein 3 [Durio zibethinus]